MKRECQNCQNFVGLDLFCRLKKQDKLAFDTCDKFKFYSARFKVYHNDKHFTTVYGDCDITSDEMRLSLINHDGYNPSIKVIK